MKQCKMSSKPVDTRAFGRHSHASFTVHFLSHRNVGPEDNGLSQCVVYENNRFLSQISFTVCFSSVFQIDLDLISTCTHVHPAKNNDVRCVKEAQGEFTNR